MRKNLRSWLLPLTVVTLTAAGLVAQTTTAQMSGQITDPTGAVIHGAKVDVTNMDKGTQRNSVSNELGNYLVPLLEPGPYRITIQKEGFRPISRSGVVLQVNQAARIDFVMELGTVTEEISVIANAPLLNSSEATQGQVIDNKRVVDLPLNGRNYAQLALLSAGTAEPVSNSRMGGVSIGGQRTTQNNYLLDGVDNNNLQNATQAERSEALRPSVEAIQEFKVLTNSYSAEFGRAVGGVVNVVLKSGTNALHGSVFTFLRNEVLDAKNFFDPPDKKRPPFKRSQFGFAVGGPVIKNKTFFFGDYEGTRVRESRTVNNTIPTMAMQAGDFSELSAPVHDPLSYDASTRTRQPFPGNSIPDSRIDSVSRKVAAWLPVPQYARLTQNFLYNPPLTDDENKYDIRVDHVINSSDNIYFRFSHQKNFQPASPSLPPPAFTSGFGNTQFTRTGTNTALVWNHIFSPSVFTSSRVAWNKIYSVQEPPTTSNYNAEFGLRGVDQTLPGGANFSMSGYTSLGSGTHLPLYAMSQARQLINDTTAMVSNHTIKFGVNITWIQRYLNNPRHAVGAFSFNGNFTNDPASRRGGDAFADFLLGIPYNTHVSTPVNTNLRAPWTGLYVQDEWRLNSRLTLSVGLRYELNLPFVDTRNKVAVFDVDTDPGRPQFVVAKDGTRLERSLMRPDKTNFAPRFGFAYHVTKNTVLRGGYGIFYGTLDMTDVPAFNPPFLTWVQITTDSIEPAFVLQEGVPAVLTPERVTNLSTTSYQTSQITGYSQQWNFNIERELGRDWLAEVGYFATKGNHLVRRWDANYALPGPGNINLRRRWSSVLWPETTIPVSPLGQSLREQFDGNSLYHSVQTKVEKRFSGGFTLLSSYIWSKTIGDLCGQATMGNAPGCSIQNPLNFHLERGLDNQHLAHRFVGSSIWDLPFGHARRWGSDWGSFVDLVAGQWALASIVTLTSGQPLTPTVLGNPANTNSDSRPNVVGSPVLSSSERSLDRWFNTEALVPNNQFAYGNAGRNILIGPGTANVDFAVYKRFSISERLQGQFRFEAFNFFNTPAFGFPAAVVGRSDYGTITSAGRPRNLQFGLKLMF